MLGQMRSPCASVCPPAALRALSWDWVEPGQISKGQQQSGRGSEAEQADLGPGQLPLSVILEVYLSEKPQHLWLRATLRKKDL